MKTRYTSRALPPVLRSLQPPASLVVRMRLSCCANLMCRDCIPRTSELSMPPVAAPARAMAVEELLARVDDQAHMDCTVRSPLKLIWVVPGRNKERVC